MAVVLDSGALGGVQEPSQPTLSVPALRKTTSHNTLNRRLELELSPNFGRPDGPQTMSFVSSADITVFAERVERLYEYGWSAVSNPCTYRTPSLDLVKIRRTISLTAMLRK